MSARIFNSPERIAKEDAALKRAIANFKTREKSYNHKKDPIVEKNIKELLFRKKSNQF